MKIFQSEGIHGEKNDAMQKSANYKHLNYLE